MAEIIIPFISIIVSGFSILCSILGFFEIFLFASTPTSMIIIILIISILTLFLTIFFSINELKKKNIIVKLLISAPSGFTALIPMFILTALTAEGGEDPFDSFMKGSTNTSNDFELGFFFILIAMFINIFILIMGILGIGNFVDIFISTRDFQETFKTLSSEISSALNFQDTDLEIPQEISENPEGFWNNLVNSFNELLEKVKDFGTEFLEGISESAEKAQDIRI